MEDWHYGEVRTDKANQRKTYPKHLQRGMSKSKVVFLVKMSEVRELEAHNYVCDNKHAEKRGFVENLYRKCQGL